MTEAEWLATQDWEAMERFLGQHRGNNQVRKWRLYHCESLHDLWRRAGFPNRHAVNDFLLELIERRVDGVEADAAFDRFLSQLFHEGLVNSLGYLRLPGFQSLLEAARSLASGATAPPASQSWNTSLHLHSRAVARAGHLREVFGNPFRLARLDPAWIAWEGGMITRIAKAIYDERAFHGMPTLSD